MNVLPIAKEALVTLWRNKKLWIFGLFVSAGAGGVSFGGEGPPPATELIVAGGVAMLAFLVASLVSEGALIEGVRRAHRGEASRVRDLTRLGVRRFGRVLAIRALYAVVAITVYVIALLPGLTLVFVAESVALMVVGITLTMILAVVAIPIVLTLSLIQEWALRSAVLEDAAVVSALAAGARFLRGRLAPSLKLLIVDALAQIAASLVGVILALPGLALGGVVYLATDAMVTSLVAGAILVIPAALAIQGARGTFRSGLWTLGFLSQRPSLGA